MSFIYSITCSTCGRDLDTYEASMDRDQDISITVGACEECVSQARAEGIEEGQGE